MKTIDGQWKEKQLQQETGFCGSSGADVNRCDQGTPTTDMFTG